MNSERQFLIVVYVMIPLMLMTPFLPVLVSIEQRETMIHAQQGILLYPMVVQRQMGLMTPADSSDRVYSDYEAVLEVLDEIPDDYVKNNLAVGANATIATLKTLLSTTDRLHVAAHGGWSEDLGPIINLYNGRVTGDLVQKWSDVKPCCQLVVLSACDSMGHDGVQDNRLASAMTLRTGVKQVIGYKDVVDVGGAAMFASLFWTAHLWQYQEYGGVSSDAAYNRARDGLHQIICDESLRAQWNTLLIVTIVGIIIALVAIFIPPASILAVPLGIIVAMFYLQLYQSFVNAMNSAYYNVVRYGYDVPGLSYGDSGGSGGGGGSSGPIDVVC